VIKPTSSHAKNYRRTLNDSKNDPRLTTDVFYRNKDPIVKALTPYLEELDGQVLEIGSGTGQHLINLAQKFPNITWQGSDLDEIHCKSTDAWAKDQSLNILKTLKLDASTDWANTVEHLKEFDLIFSMNVIHIAPISVINGFFENANQILKKGGLTIFYGPFKKGNNYHGEGNKIFDQKLKKENPDWGLRCMNNIIKLAKVTDFLHYKTIEMPANNHVLVFKKLN
jgi:SAM-dependent methyltransferase